MITKIPHKTTINVKNKKTNISYVLKCFHKPKSEEFAFSDINNPYAKMMLPEEVNKRFEIDLRYNND